MVAEERCRGRTPNEFQGSLRGRTGALTVLPLIYTLLLLVSLLIGRYFFITLHPTQVERIILLEVRLPRVIAVSLAGAALGLAGIAFQNVFRNPLAGPGILGVTSGSAFGAALAILVAPFVVTPMAFTFGLLAVFVAYRLGERVGGTTLSLVLSGIIVSAVFSALLGMIKYLADPYNKLPAIVYWLLGSFAGVGWSQLPTAVPMVAGIIGIFLLRWVLNVMSMGDEARALGVNVTFYRKVLVILGTLATAAATSLAGMIAWIGLVSPHIARLLVGYDNMKAVPTTALVGASLLLLCDDIARTLTPAELPLSVVTDLVAAPVLFIILMRRGVYGTR